MKTYDTLTEEQRKAVLQNNGNALVSASAGSGKTFVMIERVIRLILEGKADADSILAVTYTKLAAEEMKEKLVKAVIAEINEGGDSERFRKTLAEIPTSDISTFHSFCANLLRTYFYAAKIDPLFDIADESDAKELQSKAIDRLFESLYEEKNEDFLSLVRIFRKNRGDAALKEHVETLYRFAISEKDPAAFLTDGGKTTYEQTVNALTELQNAKLDALLREVGLLKKESSSLGIAKLCDHLATVEVSLLSVKGKTEPKERAFAAGIPLERSPLIKSEDESVLLLKERIKEIKSTINGLYEDICSCTDDRTDEENRFRYAKAEETERKLGTLCVRFHEKYAEVKAEENKLDFSDLEHFAYRLLKENEDVRKSVSEKYDYIFADEYQDVNGVQEAILNLIARDNLFMVGDVKQSIYAFRGCNPDIFAAKFSSYREGSGTAISLDRNFRSSDGVLSAVNNVFSEVITEDFGGVDYASNRMERGGLYPKGNGEATLHILTKTQKEKTPPNGVYDLLSDVFSEDEDVLSEGVLVGKIIEEELGKPFFDLKLGKERPVGLGDIAVLTRTSAGYTLAVVKQLMKLGIPVSSEAKNSIGDYPEIRILIAALKLIAFYADDVPLAVVLKSSIGKVTEEELAEIRRFSEKPSSKASFRECVDYYIENGEEPLKGKLRAFRDYFAKIRLLAEFSGAGEILSRLLRETGLDMEIAGMPLGKLRLARVERFIAEATRGGKKISVVRFLETIEHSLSEISLSEISGDDTVQVMSIHASKGLEFPVVIVAGISKRFNFDDGKKEIMTDRTFGIAVKYYDEQTMTVGNTVKRTLFRERMKLNVIKEEARIFYVAMTRAKARLHLVTTGDVHESRTPSSLLFAASYADFISLADMKIRRYDEDELSSPDRAAAEKKILLGTGRDSLRDRIAENLAFRYPFEDAVRLPVKRAVTAIVTDEASAKPVTDLWENEVFSPRSPFKKEAGIAYHAFLQHWDFQEKNADKELIRQLSSGELTREQGELLDKNLLGKLMQCHVFSDLSRMKCYREHPFVVPVPAKEIDKDSQSEETVLVQGIVDLLALSEDGSAVIVDYKYSSRTDESLLSAYRLQLDLYRKALRLATGIERTECYLLNLKTSRLVKVPD